MCTGARSVSRIRPEPVCYVAHTCAEPIEQFTHIGRSHFLALRLDENVCSSAVTSCTRFSSLSRASSATLNTLLDPRVRGQRLEVRVGKHGVLFPHSAEPFNGVDKLLIKLKTHREREYIHVIN